ncbi:MAG: AmmeMemoRadiSam system protein A [Armatimonadia bacterium]
MLTPTQRATLLTIARESVMAACCNAAEPDLTTDDPYLTAVQGAFVTLHAPDGDLRGCIGHIEGHEPLIETVADMAVAAATQDPRFPRVRCEEVPGLRIEISVMSPIREVKEVGEIEVGRHGLIVTCGYRRGLLLPQVATEYAWTCDEFLCHTCIKAGLPPHAWREPQTTIECFEAEVFSEERSR